MFCNLKAEMARTGLDDNDIAGILAVSKKTVNNKIEGRTDFNRSEMLKIKHKILEICASRELAPGGTTLDYLFEKF